MVQSDQLEAAARDAREAERDAIAAERDAREARRSVREEERAVKAAAWRERHEAELEDRRRARAAERADRRVDRSALGYEPWELKQAEQMGLSIDELLALKAKQREKMASLPSIEEQMRNAKVVG